MKIFFLSLGVKLDFDVEALFALARGWCLDLCPAEWSNHLRRTENAYYFRVSGGIKRHQRDRLVASTFSSSFFRLFFAIVFFSSTDRAGSEYEHRNQILRGNIRLVPYTSQYSI